MSKLNNFVFFCIIVCAVYCAENDERNFKWPTVGISVLVRNKAKTLPYFFSCLLNLDYPKDRLYVWIYSDLNEDNSVAMVEQWAKMYGAEYSSVHITAKSSKGHSQLMEQASNWSKEHFRHVIKLREEALNFSRKMWADFLFMLDADVFLTDPQTLKILVNKDESIVAPMLMSDGLYSNFWCGMTDYYYYKRTEEYKPIRERKNIDCHDVLMVHTAVLISMRDQRSDLLTYDPSTIKTYNGPEDDIITFAVNARSHEIPMKICNDHVYGYLPIPSDLNTLPEQMINVKLEAISHGTPIPLNKYYETLVSYPKPWKFGCDEIYVINLVRREERKRLMSLAMKEIGMNATIFKAVDGSGLLVEDLTDFEIKLMPGYEDPYHKRPMKAGEIGCFLSHYLVWEEIVDKNLAVTLVLEDDVQFVPYFRHKFYQLMEEIKDLNWDLVYIGRKILQHDGEVHVTEHTTKPLYSYWTLGYLLSETGAKKLLDADPLSKMLPVDEFLPIMFDQHPNESWKANFPLRNLNAFSAAPLLVHPTHYTGQPGYISDTEDSQVWDGKSRMMRNEL